MILYFDLDARQLVNAPGEGGILRDITVTRGDYQPLEIHFLKGGEEVADSTNIVAVLKQLPGDGQSSLAQCITWTPVSTYYTGFINLSGEDLNTLLGSETSILLYFEVNCFYEGNGPITAKAVKTTIRNDYWRGDEEVPAVLPDPEAWLEARRPAPLELTSPPEDGVTVGTSIGQLAIVEAADGLDPLLTTHDVWTCVQVSPPIWQPPGDIMRDRTTGTLWRNSLDSGVPSLNLAYN